MSKFERNLFCGAEWAVNVPLWVILQLSNGIAYLRSEQANNELPVGGLVVIPPNSPVVVLASVLAEATLRGCSIKISSLSGLLTSAERLCLEMEAAKECAPFRQVAATHPLAERMEQWFQSRDDLNLPVRLGLVQSFAEWLAPSLEKVGHKSNGAEQDPKGRLKQFINQIPESEMTELCLGDIAKSLCCCERHASRLFHDVCGCSFRKYISELRLNKACLMLSQGHYKIIDVAMESGHSSLALFNYNFKNRFRMTPTQWRERHVTSETRRVRTNGQASMALAVLLLFGFLALNLKADRLVFPDSINLPEVTGIFAKG